MKRNMRALIVVAALVVAGGCTAQDWNNAMRGAADGWNQSFIDHDNRQRRLERSQREARHERREVERNALLAEQNRIAEEHARHPFGRRW